MNDTQALTRYQFTIDSAVAEWIAQKHTRTGSQKTRQAYAAFASLNDYSMFFS